MANQPCKSSSDETHKKGDRVYYYDSADSQNSDKMKPARVLHDDSSSTELTIERVDKPSEYGHGRLVEKKDIYAVYDDDVYAESKKV